MRFGKPLQGTENNKTVYREAAKTLKALHSAKLCHTDCRKPNVLTFEDGPQLVDFGLVRAVDKKAVYDSLSPSRSELFPLQLNALLADSETAR
jgi:tRNA A-37 threonylcarbamoyl transferase component Bud32